MKTAFEHAQEQMAKDILATREDLKSKLAFVKRHIDDELARLQAREDFVPSLGITQTLSDAMGDAGKLRMLLDWSRDMKHLAAAEKAGA